MQSPKVLYISYNGIEEPLVVSQVLAYLYGLVDLGYRFKLVTFERRHWEDAELAKLKANLQARHIEWKPVFAIESLGPFSLLTTLIMGMITARRLLTPDVRIIHARSFIPGVIARVIKWGTNTGFLYDIRGFWIDEKVYKGSIRANSMTYRLGKALESWVYAGSDHIVSLTNAAHSEIAKLRCFSNRPLPPVSTIPTCVDASRFQAKTNFEQGLERLRVGYVGSMSEPYLPLEIFRSFSAIRTRWPDAKLQLVSRSDPKLIRTQAELAGISESEYSLMEAAPTEVPAYVTSFDLGLCFIKPGYPKIASCATKLAEYFAAGVPAICNTGIGDINSLLSRHPVGHLLSDFSNPSLQQMIDNIPSLVRHENVSANCRSLATGYFSLKRGISLYDEAYKGLLDDIQNAKNK